MKSSSDWAARDASFIVVSSIAVSFSVVVVGIEAVGSKFAFFFGQNVGIFVGLSPNVFDLGRGASTGLDEKGVPSLVAGGELAPLKGPHWADEELEEEAASSEEEENESVISRS